MAIRPMSPAPGFWSGRNMDFLTPSRLSTFLGLQDGWTLHSRRPFDETWAFDLAPGARRVVVHIPTDPNDVDYTRRLVEAIEEIATATQTSADDLALNVLSVQKDRISVKMSPPDTQSLLSPGRVIGVFQDLMKFLAHVSENSEAGRRLGRALGTTPAEAATAGCEILGLAPVPVLAMPTGVIHEIQKRIIGRNLQVEHGGTKVTQRDLTLTALRALKTVRDDVRHGADVGLWAPIEDEDDRQQRTAVLVLLESTLKGNVDNISFIFTWHEDGSGGQRDTSEVRFESTEFRHLALARERYS